MSEYLPRLLDRELNEGLQAFGAVLITGPKWCGKTTTATQISKSILRMQDPDHRDSYVALAELKPSELLKGERPRLIDEWQTSPKIWDAVRLSVDASDEPGQFILTGSAEIDLSKVQHSGTGRIYELRMNTMSLFESKDSDGSVSLKGLFSSPSQIAALSGRSLNDVALMLTRGGWPRSVGKSKAVSDKLIEGYCESIIKTEVIEIDGRERNPYKMRAVLRSLSRRISSPLSKVGIIGDVRSREGASISESTLNDYLSALRGICVLDEMPAWNPNLRSKAAIRTADTVQFCDPAIAAYFLSASDGDLMKDIRTFGLLFESLVIRDLRIYAQSIGGVVFHYRDESGLEADAVIHLRDGRWGAVEVKLGESGVEEGAKHLIALRDKVNTDTVGNPSFLAVITAVGAAYTRRDGVHVIPITCLKD